MKILLYSLNYSPELTGIGKYSGEMVEWLAAKGHDVRVVCAPPYYPEWKVGKSYKSWQYRIEQCDNVRVFRCPLFVPKAPKTLSRLLHLLSFAISSFPVMMTQWAWKPDVVMVIEPTFFCVPTTLLLCKVTGAKSLLHIQDFELDAMLGLGLAKLGKIAIFCQKVESFFMCQFSAVSSISNSMLLKADMKTGEAVPSYFFPNWVDTDFIHPDADASVFRHRWGLSENTKVVLYSGNLGKKQGLDLLIEAAKLFEAENTILFLILGDGVERQALIEQVAKLNLHNVRFESLQPYLDLPALMRLADVHLVIQKKGAADAVLPSKLTTILSAGGNALITAEAETELALLCEKFPGIAKCIEPENIEQFVMALHEMLTMNTDKKARFNKIARQYALEYLNKKNVLEKFETVLQNLII
jgi:colanic acid biosynthesis glycosyl transferase WcaI